MSNTRNRIRLFGHNIDVDESRIDTNNLNIDESNEATRVNSDTLLLNSPLEASSSRLASTSYLYQNDTPIYLYHNNNQGVQTFQDLMQQFNVPNLSPTARQAILGQYLPHYRFPMLDPTVEGVKAIMDGSCPRGADITGHPANDSILRQYIDHIFPCNNNQGSASKKANQAAKLELEAFQAAMRYLYTDPSAGIIDERYNKIFMSPIWRQNRCKKLIYELLTQYEQGQLPKLRMKHDRIHYKTSNYKKNLHRGASPLYEFI